MEGWNLSIVKRLQLRVPPLSAQQSFSRINGENVGHGDICIDPGRNSVGAESLPDVSPSGIRHMIDIVDRKRRSEMIAGIRSRDTVLQRGVGNIAQGMELRFRLHGTDLPGCPDKVT